MAEDHAAFRTRVDNTLTEIKTNLLWHARIGWAAIGAAIATFAVLLSWYLPKELSSYPTKLELNTVAGKVDTLSAKVDSLTNDLNKFMSLRIGGLIPDADKAKKSTPKQLSASFQQANLLVDAALNSGVPADPESLIRSRTELRTVLTHVNLPAPVRHEAITTFGHLDTYAAFSQNVIGKVPIVKESPSRSPTGPIKAMYIATIPMTFAHFSVLDFAHQGIALVFVPQDFQGNVVAFDLRLVGLTQDLAKVRWFNVQFVDSTIEYQGGPLNIDGVTFENCQFKFGTGESSKKALAAIEKAEGKPVTIVSEFL